MTSLGNDVKDAGIFYLAQSNIDKVRTLYVMVVEVEICRLMMQGKYGTPRPSVSGNVRVLEHNVTVITI